MPDNKTLSPVELKDWCDKTGKGLFLERNGIYLPLAIDAPGFWGSFYGRQCVIVNYSDFILLLEINR